MWNTVEFYSNLKKVSEIPFSEL
eukprot:COSAG02_NODE_65879_length_257_cov_0.537975_1_plen_22_part_10